MTASIHCQSCAAPLNDDNKKGVNTKYCCNCTTRRGELLPYESVREGVARWFLDWQPDIGLGVAVQRAEHYLKSMPAWAERNSKM